MGNQNPGISIPAIGTCDRQVRQSIQDIIRRLGTTSTPAFSTITLTDLETDKLVGSSAAKALQSVDIHNFLTGTTNRISISDDGDGTATLTTPQDTHTAATPTFAGLTITNAVVMGSNSVVFQPAANATSFFQIMESTGTFPVLNVDTTNRRVGFNVALPLRTFHVHDPENTRSDFQMTHSGTGSVGDVGFSVTLNGDDAALINNQPGDVFFQTDNIVRMAILEDGKLVSLTDGTSRGDAVGLFDALNAVSGGDGAKTTITLSGFEASGTDLLIGDGVRLLFRIPSSGSTAIGAAIDAIKDLGSDANSKTNLVFSVSQNDEVLDEMMRITTLGNFGFWETAPETLFELTHTSPYITQHCSTASDADSSRKSRINFKGHQSGAEESTLARLEVSHDGAADDQKGKIILSTNDGTDADTPTPHFRMDAAGNILMGDNGITNYSKIEPDGTLEFNGAATVWNDENIGGTTVGGPTSGRPTVVTFDDNAGADTGIYTLGFAVGEKAGSVIEIPHSYKGGSDITFHVHWQGDAAPTGTDKVQWQLTYTISREATTMVAPTVITIETDYDTQYEHITSGFAAIDGTSILMGDQFHFTLERIAASADEYGGDAKYKTMGIHYELDTVGSRQITTK